MRKKLECVGKMLGPRLASFFIAHPLVRKKLLLEKCLAPGLPVFYRSLTGEKKT